MEGHVPGWAPLPVQYVDYTLWQREHLGELADPDSVIAGQVDYWEQVLAGLPECIELPTDRPCPAVSEFGAGQCGVGLIGAVAARVARVAREHNATSFMVIQAALAVLLGRLAGQVGCGGGPDRRP